MVPGSTTQTKYWGESFGYDAWGNLTGKTSTLCNAENATLTVNTQTQLSSAEYNAAGDMTSNGGATYTYNGESEMVSAGGYTYLYDGDGNRVEKTNGSTGTIYWYGAPGIVLETDLLGNPQSEYVFFGGSRIARRDVSGVSSPVYYYFSNQIHSTALITDANGNLEDDADYYPYGGMLEFNSNLANHYWFTSKERDPESGLDYFGARYYGNTFGRFTQPDWSAKIEGVPYADFTNPHCLNLYGYVCDSPIIRFDQDGHKDCNASGANCPMVTVMQVKQTVNLYEDKEDTSHITGTVEVTTNVTVTYGGSLPTTVNATATATNMGDTHYSAKQLATIGNTVAAVYQQGVAKSLGSDTARMLTATVGRESTFGLTSPNNPLQLSTSSGTRPRRTDRAFNIGGALGILSDKARSQHGDPSRTYDRYNASRDHVNDTKRFMNSYSTMQQTVEGGTYTGIPGPSIPDGLK